MASVVRSKPRANLCEFFIYHYCCRINVLEMLRETKQLPSPFVLVDDAESFGMKKDLVIPASLRTVVFQPSTDDILLYQGKQVTHVDTNEQEHQMEHIDHFVTTSLEDRADFRNRQVSLFRCLNPKAIPSERVVFRLIIIYRKIEDSSDTEHPAGSGIPGQAFLCHKSIEGFKPRAVNLIVCKKSRFLLSKESFNLSPSVLVSVDRVLLEISPIVGDEAITKQGDLFPVRLGFKDD